MLGGGVVVVVVGLLFIYFLFIYFLSIFSVYMLKLYVYPRFLIRHFLMNLMFHCFLLESFHRPFVLTYYFAGMISAARKVHNTTRRKAVVFRNKDRTRQRQAGRQKGPKPKPKVEKKPKQEQTDNRKERKDCMNLL